MAYGKNKSAGKSYQGGSPKLPTERVKNVKGGDKIQKATNRAKKGKDYK